MQMTKFIALAAVLLLACQCGCTHSGQIVRFEQRSNVGISTVEIAEYTIPIISISSGPSFTVYQREGQPCLTKISGFATTTNTTSALGIYSSSETKSMQFKDVVITNCHTNDWHQPLK